MDFFKVDGPFYRFISRLFDLIILNFLWLVFSLPIITIGASTSAAFCVTLKMAEDKEGYIGKAFLKGFRENLKQGTILGLIAISAAYIVYLNFALFNGLESNPLILLIVGMIAGAYFLFSLLYAFPLAARYQNTIIKTINNSLRIGMKYFGRTCVLLFILAVFSVISLYNLTTMILFVLLGPALFIYTISEFAIRIFRRIEEDQKSM